jgi:hypothetical protein
VLALRQEIEQATSTSHVVLLTREWVAGLTAAELQRVPEPCRPRRILDEADVLRLSRSLTQAYWQLRGTAADVGVLQELWSFFLRAAIQIARLRERAAEAG